MIGDKPLTNTEKQQRHREKRANTIAKAKEQLKEINQLKQSKTMRTALNALANTLGKIK
mgnify:CR=1 FL=1